MSGGGKGPAPQASYIDPVSGRAYWTSDQLNQAVNERESRAAAESATAKQEAEAKKASDLAAFINKRDSAYNTAKDAAYGYFKDYGLDPTAYEQDILRQLDTIKGGIQELDPNPAGAFANNVGADIYNTKQAAAQQRAIGSLDSLFGSNFGTNQLSDDLVDSTVNNIIQEQYSPLQTQLENARKRGTLNDNGYSAALRAMQQSESKARADISDVGFGKLSDYRSVLDDMFGSAKSAAGNLRLPQAQSFDPNTYYSQAADRAGTLRSGFGDSVRSAIGDTKFADITELLQAGGVGQGAYDPTITGNPSGGVGTSDLAGQIIAANKKRGLGSVGAF